MTKILIIDDEQEILDLIVEYVQSADNDAVITPSNSGKEAIQMIASNKFDLIICDRNLERGFNGAQVFEKNIETNNTPFLLLSGDIDGFLQIIPSFLNKNEKNCLMEKPFNYKKLQEYIQSFKNSIDK